MNSCAQERFKQTTSLFVFCVLCRQTAVVRSRKHFSTRHPRIGLRFNTGEIKHSASTSSLIIISQCKHHRKLCLHRLLRCVGSTYFFYLQFFFSNVYACFVLQVVALVKCLCFFVLVRNHNCDKWQDCDR